MAPNKSPKSKRILQRFAFFAILIIVSAILIYILTANRDNLYVALPVSFILIAFVLSAIGMTAIFEDRTTSVSTKTNSYDDTGKRDRIRIPQDQIAHPEDYHSGKID